MKTLEQRVDDLEFMVIDQGQKFHRLAVANYNLADLLREYEKEYNRLVAIVAKLLPVEPPPPPEIEEPDHGTKRHKTNAKGKDR